jgi:hypothetical protein
MSSGQVTDWVRNGCCCAAQSRYRTAYRHVRTRGFLG